MKLAGRLLTIGEITADEREQMFALMQRHFANVRRDVFENDLAEKQWVIQVADPQTGRLCGFSTQMLLEVEQDGRPLKALFSGDTIIDRVYWGDPMLFHLWGQLALALIDESPDRDLVWFLISQGYKTYRILPVFFHEYYPRFDRPNSAWANDAIGSLARQKFARGYCESSGVVKATSRQYRLRRNVAELTSARLRDPHVRFFAKRNPGHAAGDELCCLAPLTRDNFTIAAWRVIGREHAALGTP